MDFSDLVDIGQIIAKEKGAKKVQVILLATSNYLTSDEFEAVWG